MHLPRQALRKALLERLAPGTVRWGRRFEGYVEHPAKAIHDGDGAECIEHESEGDGSSSREGGGSDCDVGGGTHGKAVQVDIRLTLG